MPKRSNDPTSEEFYMEQYDDNQSGQARKKLSTDQKKEILRIVESSLTTTSSSSSSSSHNVDHHHHHHVMLPNPHQYHPNDNLADKLSLDQRREILSLIEQGIEVTGDTHVESSLSTLAYQPTNIQTNMSTNITNMMLNRSSSVSITRSQKNELSLLLDQALEALVDDHDKNKRRHYTKEQKDDMLGVMLSCSEDGMSTNAAIKYLNTIPGYEKVTRKMIREWRINRYPAPRGRKVSHEFEIEVAAELLSMTGHDITSPVCNIKEIAFEDVRRAAIAVRDRYYDGEGQKWLIHPKTKDLHFSSNWVRKLLARGARAGAVHEKVVPGQNAMLELETDSDEAE